MAKAKPEELPLLLDQEELTLFFRLYFKACQTLKGRHLIGDLPVFVATESTAHILDEAEATKKANAIIKQMYQGEQKDPTDTELHKQGVEALAISIYKMSDLPNAGAIDRAGKIVQALAAQAGTAEDAGWGLVL